MNDNVRVINHTINDDLKITENTVINATVNGDLEVVNATVTVNATVNGDLDASGSTVDARATINGDITARNSTVTVHGTVNGDLVKKGKSEFVVKDSAQINGEWEGSSFGERGPDFDKGFRGPRGSRFSNVSGVVITGNSNVVGSGNVVSSGNMVAACGHKFTISTDGKLSIDGVETDFKPKGNRGGSSVSSSNNRADISLAGYEIRVRGDKITVNGASWPETGTDKRRSLFRR